MRKETYNPVLADLVGSGRIGRYGKASIDMACVPTGVIGGATEWTMTYEVISDDEILENGTRTYKKVASP